jgi:hypothetical protein
MKELIAQHASTALQSDKIAQGVAAVTASTGLATFFNLITPVVGVLTGVCGLILSVVFIISKRKSDRREEEKHQIEMAILKKELE